MPTRSEIEHLLRRTEFVARPARVTELMAKPSLAAAVVDILNVPADPGSLQFGSGDDWNKVLDMTIDWIDRMAHVAARPMQERMALFWHGHFCSDFPKVASATAIREQIDTFRTIGLGNFINLTKVMSTQVAMLRYLDNNQNRQTSPNQNFGRELMELFTLGVGNYTEADVEASAAAWTGHTDDPVSNTYVWRPDWHDSSWKSFLGYTISKGVDRKYHGYETIDVILGAGVVPYAAAQTGNRGRPTKEVAAEFLSRKLWRFFAGTEPSANVLTAMRQAAISSGFEVKPWLTAMLTHPEFYGNDVRNGLVRSPVDYVVALLVATGLRSAGNTPTWLMATMGQLLFYPPDVSGWKQNGYWVNAAAMSGRTESARHFAWRCWAGYWDASGNGSIRLMNGAVTMQEMGNYYVNRPAELVDRFASLIGLTLSATTRNALISFTANSPWPERNDAVALMLMSPEFQRA
jgi:uncharacterized protein (DUF1800 family)